ncbi:MAG TPA: peptidoglycan DD-metalloendopeptidase family protein [Pyrinomonadaceae bacterium]|nr:peptidoglycan DD-metalloendopeptidase family protein [Pyrinomonadaceae bacterium]
MVRDDRLYAFIIAHTSRSRSQIRRICVHKRWLKLSAVIAVILFFAAAYGIYGLTQHLRHRSVEQENARLRAENERQKQQLNNLNNRVERVEDASRKLAEMSGVSHDDGQAQPAALNGAGGPFVPVDDAAVVEYKTNHLEQELLAFEVALRERAAVPSLWPVAGTLESGFGVRRNPFGGSSYESHEGQDIEADMGTPVDAAASGTVTVAGAQNGYGNVVYIDHGNGIQTRYGHLSRIDVAVGQQIKRGERLGLVGSTGRSTGPHLHYEVRIDNQTVNPRPYLPGAGEEEQ